MVKHSKRTKEDARPFLMYKIPGIDFKIKIDALKGKFQRVKVNGLFCFGGNML